MMKQLIILIGICCAASFLMSDDKKADNSAIIKAVMTTVDADMKKGYAGRKQAIKKLEQLLTIDTDCIEAYFKLAECYRRNSKKEKAVEYYKIVVDKIGDPTVGDLGMWYNQSIKYLDKLDPVSKQIRELNEQHVAGLKALYRRYKDKRIVDELAKLEVEVQSKTEKKLVNIEIEGKVVQLKKGALLMSNRIYIVNKLSKELSNLETHTIEARAPKNLEYRSLQNGYVLIAINPMDKIELDSSYTKTEFDLCLNDKGILQEKGFMIYLKKVERDKIYKTPFQRCSSFVITKDIRTVSSFENEKTK